MTEKKVLFDYSALCQAIKEKGKSKTEFGIELGKSRGYIWSLKDSTEISETVEKLMCLLLGKEPGYFAKREPEPEEKKPAAEAAVLQNIFQKLCSLEKKIDALTEEQTAVFRKCNANTIQIERIREAVDKLGQTEHDRATEFLQDALKNGRVNAFDLLSDADEQGIKRSEIMKAKKELNVVVDSSGYGKSQKSWWHMGE